MMRLGPGERGEWCEMISEIVAGTRACRALQNMVMSMDHFFSKCNGKQMVFNRAVKILFTLL